VNQGKKLKHMLEKVEVLVATGLPGLYKILVLFFITETFGLSTVGVFASEFSISQIVAFFTAIGWSSLILVRVPQRQGDSGAWCAYISILIMATMSFVPLLIAVFIVYYSLGISAYGVICLVISWSLYQMHRHYYVSLKKYRKLILYDSVLIALSIASVAITHENYVSVTISSSMFATFVVFFISDYTNKKIAYAGFDLKGLELGASNFFSGVIPLAIVPLAHYHVDEQVAGIISIFLAVTAAVLLIPRAISLYKFPDITRLIKIGSSAKVSLCYNIDFVARNIEHFNRALSLISAAVILAWYYYPVGFLAPVVFYVSLGALVLSNYFSIKTLAASNVLMASEKTTLLMKINFFSSACFFFVVLICYFHPGWSSFFSICFSASLIGFFRYISVQRRSDILIGGF